MKYFILTGLAFLITLPGKTADPSFLIQEIRVEGTHTVSEEIILTQSLLRAQISYTEEELRRARNRLIRLPFILDASFSLEKGSERDTYILVLKITEVKRFTYELQGEYLKVNYDQDSNKWDSSLFGFRQNVGAYGMAFASVTPSEKFLGEDASVNTYNLGYANYGLFGSRLTMSYELGYEPSFDYDGGSYQVDFGSRMRHSLTLSMPLKGDQWLRASVRRTDFDLTINFGEGYENIQEKNDSLLLSWEHNTLNDNFLPTEGHLLRFGGDFSEGNTSAESSSRTYTVNRPNQLFFGEYEKYHSFRERHSFSYNLRLAQVNHEQENQYSDEANVLTVKGDDSFVTAKLGYYFDLWGRDLTLRYGDFRFITTYTYNHSESSVSPSSNDSIDYRSSVLDVNLVHRNSWGTLKLTYKYIKEL